LIPPDARVGDALPVHESRWIRELLASCDEEALDHHAGDTTLAGRDLGSDVARDGGLPKVISLAVPVARIDDEPLGKARLPKRVKSAAYARLVVVRTAGTAPQDHVTVGISARAHERRKTLLGDADEAVRVRG